MAASARPKAFAVWFKDLERWSVGSFVEMGWLWPRDVVRPLSDALTRKMAAVDRKATPDDAIRLATLHFDGGIEPRNQSGTKPIKGRLFWAEPGNVIYSKIDVRNGAIGIIPKDMGRVCVSTEYPVYRVKADVAEASYVKLLFRTDEFLGKINSMISGASGRKRVQPTDLERLEVPLPPLPTQRAIIWAWEQTQREVAMTRQRIAELGQKIEADFLTELGLSKTERALLPKVFAVPLKDLKRWSVMFNQLASVSVDLTSGKYPVSTLGEVASVSYGIQKCPANRPGQHARPYLRVANVQRGELDLREVKTINVPDAEMPSYRLAPGDLLFVEGNGSRAELGRCALWCGEIDNCVHQNHILKVRPDPSQLLPDYAVTWFNTDAGKDHFFCNVKSTSGLGSINSTELRGAPIPMPPLHVQRRVVKMINSGRERIAVLKAQADQKAEQARTDVEAIILGGRHLG